MLLALGVYPLRRRQLLAILKEKTPFFLVSIIVSVVMLVIGVRRDLMTDLHTLGVFDRLAITAYGLCFYLLKTVVPWPLSPLYELHYPVRVLTATYLVPAVTVAVISAALIALNDDGRRGSPCGRRTSRCSCRCPVCCRTANRSQRIATPTSRVSAWA